VRGVWRAVFLPRKRLVLIRSGRLKGVRRDVLCEYGRSDVLAAHESKKKQTLYKRYATVCIDTFSRFVWISELAPMPLDAGPTATAHWDAFWPILQDIRTQLGGTNADLNRTPGGVPGTPEFVRSQSFHHTKIQGLF
jgi:hypothetical protein